MIADPSALELCVRVLFLFGYFLFDRLRDSFAEDARTARRYASGRPETSPAPHGREIAEVPSGLVRA